jgi:hypothetical protein
MIVLVNLGQENTYSDRNKKPEIDEDGERKANRTRCQGREQHRRQTNENGHPPNVRRRAHSSSIIRSEGIRRNSSVCGCVLGH